MDQPNPPCTTANLVGVSKEYNNLPFNGPGERTGRTSGRVVEFSSHIIVYDSPEAVTGVKSVNGCIDILNTYNGTHLFDIIDCGW